MELADLMATRATLEPAIPSLIGTPTSAFALAPAKDMLHIAVMPVVLPPTWSLRSSTALYEQRRAIEVHTLRLKYRGDFGARWRRLESGRNPARAEPGWPRSNVRAAIAATHGKVLHESTTPSA